MTCRNGLAVVKSRMPQSLIYDVNHIVTFFSVDSELGQITYENLVKEIIKEHIK